MRESVKPMEKIEGIRILHVDGLAGGRQAAAVRTPTDEVIESALRYRVQAPLIDQVLKEIGIEGGSLAKMGGLIREAATCNASEGSPAAKAEGRAAGQPRCGPGESKPGARRRQGKE